MALQLSEEFSSGSARLRFDVHGTAKRSHVLDTVVFLNYRLANVEIAPKVSRGRPDIVWYQDEAVKSVVADGDTLTLRGEWFQGELQKIIVSVLALRLEEVGLHPFHSSAVRYKDKTILFLGGESNHGKSMSQIEGCRRGGYVVSTETTITDERGVVVMGSKNVFLQERSKGTERADKLDQHQGVAKFFDATPDFVDYDEPSNVDLVVVPSIDGNFDTIAAELAPFERSFQTYHSLMNYFGLHDLLAPGLPMPLLDTDDKRVKRADFCRRFAERPYFIVRASNPRLLFDEVEKLL